MTEPADETLLELRAAVLECVRGQPSLEAAAQQAGCSPRTLARIFYGRNVTIKTAARIAVAFGYRIRITLEKTAT